MVDIARHRFEELVGEAIDALPDELAAAIDNLVVRVHERHPDDPELLGLYEGVPLTERADAGGGWPDIVTIYREPLLQLCGTEDEVRDEVRVTVIHELAHHFGVDDDRLDELGWA